MHTFSQLEGTVPRLSIKIPETPEYAENTKNNLKDLPPPPLAIDEVNVSPPIKEIGSWGIVRS